MQRKVWDAAAGGAPDLNAQAGLERRSAPPRSIGKTYFELTKAKQTFMALATTAAGFYSAGRDAFSWTLFAWALAGSALAMSGASVLNEWAERKEDAGMERTRERPLPSGAASLTDPWPTCAKFPASGSGFAGAGAEPGCEGFEAPPAAGRYPGWKAFLDTS